MCQPGWEGRLREKGHMYVYGWVSLVFTTFAETITTLLIGDTAMQNKKLFKKNQCSVQLSHSVMSDSLWPQVSLFITNCRSLPKPMSTESVMPSNYLILYRPLLLLPSTFRSIRVFSNESALHIMWPKYWSLSFSIIPSNEYSRLISFRMDWFK